MTIDDFNDNAPNITTQNTTLKVMENVTINTEVIDINATDNDIGPNANITFSIRMKENGYFNINSTTVSIFLKFLQIVKYFCKYKCISIKN